MRYRILKENGKYFIQKKGWFWWSYVEDCYMYGTGVVSFSELKDAEVYLDNIGIQPVVVSEV